jgi:hypothetical protein
MLLLPIWMNHGKIDLVRHVSSAVPSHPYLRTLPYLPYLPYEFPTLTEQDGDFWWRARPRLAHLSLSISVVSQ